MQGRRGHGAAERLQSVVASGEYVGTGEGACAYAIFAGLCGLRAFLHAFADFLRGDAF